MAMGIIHTSRIFCLSNAYCARSQPSLSTRSSSSADLLAPAILFSLSVGSKKESGRYSYYLKKFLSVSYSSQNKGYSIISMLLRASNAG